MGILLNIRKVYYEVQMEGMNTKVNIYGLVVDISYRNLRYVFSSANTYKFIP